MGSNLLRDIIFYRIKDHMEERDFYVVNADFIGRPLIAIKEEFPTRFIQAGIAEQNMIAIACGLALEGKRPITFSPNPFEYLRAYDQIRNGICAMNLPVIIIGNGMGMVNPGLGITHITSEDYQLFSLCPNMQILTISDEVAAEVVADEIIRGIDTPTYIRIDYDCDKRLPAEESIDLKKGFRYIRHGNRMLVVTQGYAVQTALKAENTTAIIDLFRRPFDVDAFFREFNKYEKIIVLEEQQRRGGLGSELLELCNSQGICKDIQLVGIDYGERLPETFGSREYWMRSYGVDVLALNATIGLEVEEI